MNKPQDFDQYWKKVEDELASIQPQQVAMVSTLRGNQGEAVKNICLVTPEITNTYDELVNFSEIKINKPLIYITSPSQKLSIIKNGSIVWESSDILGPIRLLGLKI